MITTSSGARRIAMATLAVGLITTLLTWTSCSSTLTDDPIPYQPFGTITINLNLPEYNALKTDGGYKYIDGGVRGIIVYRVSSTSYRAFERNCSFHPNEACSTVEVHPTTLFMFDPCCGSNFNFNGEPTSGPAWRELRQYYADLDGFDLTITDDVLN